jgi:Rrf2 family protein
MMNVSTKTEYGLRCLLLLARQPEQTALSITQIAGQEHLPKQYVQQILLRLRRAGLVTSTRGTQGGFALAKSPSEISVASVLRVLEGVPFEDACGHFNRKSNCGHLGGCSIRPVWQTISLRLWEALDRIHLRHLISNEEAVGQTLAIELPVLTSAPLAPPSFPRR